MQTVDFGSLQVGDMFYFADRPIESQPDISSTGGRFTKVDEQKRGYTPEPYSNARKSWRNVDPRDGRTISEGTTFFYVNPATRVMVRQ